MPSSVTVLRRASTANLALFTLALVFEMCSFLFHQFSNCDPLQEATFPPCLPHYTWQVWLMRSKDPNKTGTVLEGKRKGHRVKLHVARPPLERASFLICKVARVLKSLIHDITFDSDFTCKQSQLMSPG